jgi:hypothetical protein
MRTDPTPAPARVFTSPWLKPKDAADYSGVSVQQLATYRSNRRKGIDPRGPDFSNPHGEIYRYHVHVHLDAWLLRGESDAPNGPIALAAPLLEGADNAT